MSLSERLPPNVIFILKNQHLRIKSKYHTIEQNDRDVTSVTKRKNGRFSKPYLQHLLVHEDEEDNPDAQPVAILVTFIYDNKLTKYDLKNAIALSTISRYKKPEEKEEKEVMMKPSEELPKETKDMEPILKTSDFLDIILVLNEDVTPPALTSLNEFVKQSASTLNIQVIKRKDIAWDKSDNHYVHTYEVKESSSIPAFLKEHKITDISKLPRMFSADPMAKLYGFKIGQLVKSVNSNYWRIVVPENQISVDDEDIIVEGKQTKKSNEKQDDGNEDVDVEVDPEVEVDADLDVDVELDMTLEEEVTKKPSNQKNDLEDDDNKQQKSKPKKRNREKKNIKKKQPKKVKVVEVKKNKSEKKSKKK